MVSAIFLFFRFVFFGFRREGVEVEVEISTRFFSLIFFFLQKNSQNKTGVKPDWPLDGYRYSWRMKDATDGKLTG